MCRNLFSWNVRCLQTHPQRKPVFKQIFLFLLFRKLSKSSFRNPKPFFHLTTALNTSYIFLVPSEQCPWKLLLELQQLLLLTLSSSAVSVLPFGIVLPSPEQQEWQFWWTAPSRWNPPCSKEWKISYSNLLTLPFVPVLQLCCWSAPCGRACMNVPFQENFVDVFLSAHIGEYSSTYMKWYEKKFFFCFQRKMLVPLLLLLQALSCITAIYSVLLSWWNFAYFLHSQKKKDACQKCGLSLVDQN